MKTLREELDEAFERFKSARAKSDIDTAKKAAREVLSILERINSQPQSAVLVQSLGEHINRVSTNAAHEQQIEKDVKEYLQKVESEPS
jgi:hypothetical protein